MDKTLKNKQTLRQKKETSEKTVIHASLTPSFNLFACLYYLSLITITRKQLSTKNLMNYISPLMMPT